MSGRGTALVTGASSGIGEAYAKTLASQGYDLVLTARRGEKLEQHAEAIRDSSRRQVTVVSADLATRKGQDRVIETIGRLPNLTLLVNNAGFGTTGPFAEVEPGKHEAMVEVHVTAAVRLTRAALPGMLARGEGAVVLLSSISSLLPSPNRTLYGATKAMLNRFGDSLALELAGSGVRVQVLAPGFTYSGFHDTEEFAGWSRSQVGKSLWMSAEEVVEISLEELGRNRRVLVVPGWRNRLLVALGSNPLTRRILYAQQKRRFRKG